MQNQPDTNTKGQESERKLLKGVSPEVRQKVIKLICSIERQQEGRRQKTNIEKEK